jgi:hypothetical protein
MVCEPMWDRDGIFFNTTCNVKLDIRTNGVTHSTNAFGWRKEVLYTFPSLANLR